MAQMLVRNRVADYETWRKVFDEELGAVRAAGMDVVNVWRSTEDLNEVFFLFSISDMSKAVAFTKEPSSAAAGVRAGVLEGEIHYVEDVSRSDPG